MAVKFILTQGIGFNPGSVKYLPTLGFNVRAVAAAIRVAFTNEALAAHTLSGESLAGHTLSTDTLL